MQIEQCSVAGGQGRGGAASTGSACSLFGLFKKGPAGDAGGGRRERHRHCPAVNYAHHTAALCHSIGISARDCALPPPGRKGGVVLVHRYEAVDPLIV